MRVESSSHVSRKPKSAGRAVPAMLELKDKVFARMLRNWIRVLLGTKGPRASVVNRGTVVYRENGRKMTIAGEMLADGFEIYVASITTWDDSNGELIDAFERQRILEKVRASLESQGARVVLN